MRPIISSAPGEALGRKSWKGRGFVKPEEGEEKKISHGVHSSSQIAAKEKGKARCRAVVSLLEKKEEKRKKKKKIFTMLEIEQERKTPGWRNRQRERKRERTRLPRISFFINTGSAREKKKEDNRKKFKRMAKREEGKKKGGGKIRGTKGFLIQCLHTPPCKEKERGGHGFQKRPDSPKEREEKGWSVNKKRKMETQTQHSYPPTTL